MSRSVLGAFILGMALAAGGVYMAMRPSAPAAAPAAPVVAQTPPAPVAQPVVAPVPVAAPAPEPVVTKKPSPIVGKTKKTRPVEVARVEPPVAPAPAPAPAPVAAPAAPAPAPPPVETVQPQAPPPPPRQPHTVTVPAGTVVNVRLAQGLSSEQNQAGDTFPATLDQPLVVDGMVIAERGSKVQGRILSAERAGRVKGVSHMSLQLVQLSTSDGQRVSILTQPWDKEGPSGAKQDVAKAGAAAAIGAVIGAIAGGGKGAAIGAGVGGAAGAGGVMVTRGKPVVLPVETRLSFRLSEPVTLTERLQ